MTRRRDGYILIETAVAIVVLSVGAFAVHRTIQEAIRTRGQSQDYTQARFLLDQVMADVTEQPELVEGRRQGQFPAPNDRFSWEAVVQRVNVPAPTIPLKPPPRGEKPQRFAYPEDYAYLARVRVTVYWTRSQQDFSESYETLLQPDRLWQPPRERRR